MLSVEIISTPSEGEIWFEDIIQSEKLSPELKRHLLNQREFYIQLSHDEFLTYTQLLQFKKYEKGQELVACGDVHSLLFYIENGSVAIDFHDRAGITHARHLRAGDLIGHEVFMSGSEWNVTLTATERTEVFIFDQEQLLKLQQHHSHLSRTAIFHGKKKMS